MHAQGPVKKALFAAINRIAALYAVTIWYAMPQQLYAVKIMPLSLSQCTWHR